jgi:Leucine-rich repeat (LRR) protein
MDLSGSPYLLEIPDLSMAENIESINLKFCKSLIEVNPSIQYLTKLEVLQLSYCDNLRSLPSRIGSKVLRILDLYHCINVRICPAISGNSPVLRKVDLRFCANITKFPEISGNVKYLYLQGTAIEEVPSSIEFLTALVRLYMTNCKQLSSIPSSICKLKSLEVLGLSGCSKLESFPEIMEPMESLRRLDLGGTAIKELPSSIEHLKFLKHLDLSGTGIIELPELPSSLTALDVDDCKSLETLSRFNLRNFKELNFANCFKLEQKKLMADVQCKIQVNLHKFYLLLMIINYILNL